MQSNVGVVERALRTLLGLALIAWAIPIFGLPVTRWNFLGWIGFVPLITGIFGICPLYTLLGVSTCSRHSRI